MAAIIMKMLHAYYRSNDLEIRISVSKKHSA